MSYPPRFPAQGSAGLAQSWSPGDPLIRGPLLSGSFATNTDEPGSAFSGPPGGLASRVTLSLERSVGFEPCWAPSSSPGDRMTRSVPQSRPVAGSSSAPSSYELGRDEDDSMVGGPQEKSASADTLPQCYLGERTRCVKAIQTALQATTDKVKRLVRVAQIVSSVAAVLALGAALAAALTPLSGGMLLLSFAVLLAAQLGHAYSNARTARLLRESAEHVREQAFGCLELINISPAAAVLDNHVQPVEANRELQGAAQPVWPWQEVQKGLMTAAMWRKAADTYQKKGKKTLLNLAKATVFQLLKGPIAWLTVLNSIWDLFKLTSTTKKLAAGLKISRCRIKTILKDEIALLAEEETSAADDRQIKKMRDLFMLRCLIELPDSQTIKQRLEDLESGVASGAGGSERMVEDAEAWALHQWQVFSKQHSDRALQRPIEVNRRAMEDLASSTGSIRPAERSRFVQEWLGQHDSEAFEEREALVARAECAIARFLAARSP